MTHILPPSVLYLHVWRDSEFPSLGGKQPESGMSWARDAVEGTSVEEAGNWS